MVKRHIGWLFVTITMVVDALLIAAGFNLGWWLRYVVGVGGAVIPSNFLTLASYDSLRITTVAITLLVLITSGVYRMPRGRRFTADAAQVTHAALSALGLLVITVFVARVPVSSRLLLAFTGVAIIALLLAARLVARLVKQIFWRRGIGVIKVLVIGDGPAAREIMSDLLQHQDRGRRLSGCLALDRYRSGTALLVDAGQPRVVPVHGAVEDLDVVLGAHNIRQVVIALPGAAVEATEQAVRTCLRRHVDFRLVPELYGIGAQQVTVDPMYGRPVLGIREIGLDGRRRLMKRVLDIVLSILVLVPFGLLLMAVISILIKLDSRGPVFFKQRRMTRDGSIFWVYKFRSMRVDAEAELARLRAVNEAQGPIFKMRDDPRITRMGKWLRRTSLDELPQVINILLGEMSWVGPRPPLPAEVELYEEWQKRRLGTTTGLTGLWQVSGRSLLSFEEMVRLDLYYVENWSIWLDLKILFMTVPSVLQAKGAY